MKRALFGIFLVLFTFATIAANEASVHYAGAVQVWKAMGWASVALAGLGVIWKHGYPWRAEDKDCQRQLTSIKATNKTLTQAQMEDAKRIGGLEEKVKGLTKLYGMVQRGEL